MFFPDNHDIDEPFVEGLADKRIDEEI